MRFLHCDPGVCDDYLLPGDAGDPLQLLDQHPGHLLVLHGLSLPRYSYTQLFVIFLEFLFSCLEKLLGFIASIIWFSRIFSIYLSWVQPLATEYEVSARVDVDDDICPIEAKKLPFSAFRLLTSSVIHF